MAATVRRVELNWCGPSDARLDGIPASGGFYAVFGNHTVYGCPALLYIGKAEFSLTSRLHETGQKEWLRRVQNLALYVVEIEDQTAIDDVESLLIFIHQPSFNSSKLNVLNLAQPLQVWNLGTIPYGALLPILDSRYPWFGKTWA